MSQKKLPTKINILGREIKVLREEMKEGEFGEYEQHRYIIKVNKKSDYNEAMQTIFHEAVHAAIHISGLSQILPQNDFMDVEEAIVTCFENAFSDAIDITKKVIDK